MVLLKSIDLVGSLGELRGPVSIIIYGLSSTAEERLVRSLYQWPHDWKTGTYDTNANLRVRPNDRYGGRP